MKMRIPLQNKNPRSLPATGLSIGPVVLVALTLLTKASLAMPSQSLSEIDEGVLHRIPEPESMLLGILGFCLILLRRGRF